MSLIPMFSFQVWYPKRIIRAVATQELDACASPQIIDEYQEITKEMIARLQGKIDEDALSLFFQNLEMIFHLHILNYVEILMMISSLNVQRTQERYTFAVLIKIY